MRPYVYTYNIHSIQGSDRMYETDIISITEHVVYCIVWEVVYSGTYVICPYITVE